jgi:hypothetical protein
MKALSRRIGLNVDVERPLEGEPPPAERILLDISETPVTRARAYSERSLIDEDLRGQLIQYGQQVLRVGYSLNELLPHVNTLHGIRVISEAGHFLRDRAGEFVAATDRREQAHADYLAQMQSILIFVPSSFLGRLHDQLREANASRSERAGALYERYVEPILAEFWDIVKEGFESATNRHQSFVIAGSDLRAWLEDENAFPAEGQRVTPPFLD